MRRRVEHARPGGALIVVAAIGAIVILIVGGCGREPQRQAAPVRVADKEALYGDAMLVPTREGERVRLEVALAGQVEAAAKVAVDTAGVSADVELVDAPPRVTLAVRLERPDPDPVVTKASLESLARAIVKDADVHVLVTAPASESGRPAASPNGTAGLWLVLLGLGVSLGITIERLRLRIRRRGGR